MGKLSGLDYPPKCHRYNDLFLSISKNSIQTTSTRNSVVEKFSSRCFDWKFSRKPPANQVRPKLRTFKKKTNPKTPLKKSFERAIKIVLSSCALSYLFSSRILDVVVNVRAAPTRQTWNHSDFWELRRRAIDEVWIRFIQMPSRPQVFDSNETP